MCVKMFSLSSTGELIAFSLIIPAFLWMDQRYSSSSVPFGYVANDVPDCLFLGSALNNWSCPGIEGQYVGTIDEFRLYIQENLSLLMSGCYLKFNFDWSFNVVSFDLFYHHGRNNSRMNMWHTVESLKLIWYNWKWVKKKCCTAYLDHITSTFSNNCLRFVNSNFYHFRGWKEMNFQRFS